MKNSWPIHIALLVIFSGCASIDIESARKLSSTGVVTSGELLNQTISLKNEWRGSNIRTNTSRYFNNAVLPNVAYSRIAATDSRDKTTDEISEQINKQLNSRVRTFSAMTKLYKSFDDLTQFNATKSFNDSYTSLANEIDTYATKLVKDEGDRQRITEGLRGDPASIIAGGIGYFQRARHKKNIKEANRKMAAAASSVLELFKRDIKYFSSIRRYAESSKFNLYMALSKAALVDESEKLQEITRLAGYKPSPEAEKIISKNARLRVAISGYTKLLNKRTAELIAQSEASAIKSLNSLTSAHKNLEKPGTDNRISHLVSELTLLKETTDELKKELNEKPELGD